MSENREGKGQDDRGLRRLNVWRHAVNAYMAVTGSGSDYMILGPLRGGGQLVELGWIAESAASLVCRYAMAISGSQSPTLGNLRASTSLIQRSNDVFAAFGVPTIRLEPTSAEHLWIRLPMSVRLDAGAQYIIIGINVSTAEKVLHTLAWALVVGPVGNRVARVGMVNGQGLGVEDGLER